MHPEVQAFFDMPTNTVSYVVKDPQSNACAIIDPVLEFDPASARTSKVSADAICAYVEGHDLRADWILDTHPHADHLSAAPYLKERLGGKMGIGAKITIVQTVFGKIFNAGSEFQRDGSQFDALFDDGAVIELGGLFGRAIHTPGHTPACVTYVFGDAAFIGDTFPNIRDEERRDSKKTCLLMKIGVIDCRRSFTWRVRWGLRRRCCRSSWRGRTNR